MISRFVWIQKHQGLDLDNHIFRLERWTLGIHREGTNTYISEVTLGVFAAINTKAVSPVSRTEG